jgi:hypothetical protein
MKKIFTISMAILVSSFAIATPRLQAKKIAKEVKADAEVTIYYADEEDPGIIEIIWQGDSEISPAYDVQIGRLDTATYDYGLITDIASYSSNFAVDGYDGYFAISSDLCIEYGDNYSTIGDYGASADVIAKWQAAWEASVNEADYTLKAGFYIIFVEGMDLSFNTTEDYDYAIVEIKDVTTGTSELIENEKKSLKFINPSGRMIIFSNGAYYDCLGRKIQ